MRISFFVRTLNQAAGGGSHYNAIQYIRALRSHGHTVTVHVFYQQGNSFPEDIQPVVHEAYGFGLVKERDYLVQLLKELEKDSDVFFLYGVDFIWGGGKYRRLGGKIPCEAYLDAYLSSMGLVNTTTLKAGWYRYKRWFWDKTIGMNDAQHLDRFLPCSPYIGDVYKNFGFPRNRFVVLPNIVPNTTAGVAQPHTAEDQIKVLYIGRLIYDKGIDLLVEALGKLSQFNVKLTIVGDGDLRPKVEELSRKYSLNVTMAGWVPQETVGAFYRDADIFVHPARYPDPAPRTIVDALSYSLPVIVPRKGGSAWIAGESGLVFENGDVHGLTQHLAQLLANTNSVRERLASKGIARAREFEEPIVYPQLEQALTFSN